MSILTDLVHRHAGIVAAGSPEARHAELFAIEGEIMRLPAHGLADALAKLRLAQFRASEDGNYPDDPAPRLIADAIAALELLAA
jgi:hypothetical protein